MNLIRHIPRFHRAYQSLGALAERESWSRREIESFQLERLNAVWQHAVKYVPYYRELRVGSALPPRFGSLEEFQEAVPVLSKAEVRAQPRRFLSERPAPGCWRRTGGSTGMPMSVYRETQAHLEVLRAKYRFYQTWNIDIFDRTVYLWGHSAALVAGFQGRVAKLLQPLEDWCRNRLRLSAYRLGKRDLQDYLAAIRSFRPVSAYGYSQAFGLLAEEAEAAGFHCDSLKLFMLTGEPAFPSIVEKIERAFHVPAVVEYGATECGLIAAEGPDRKLRVREDLVLMETAAQADGHRNILLSVLNNPSFPLLRYAIDDTTDAPLERPERGFAILDNVAGRNNDVVVTRSGRYIHSALFEAVFKYHAQPIRRFRVRQGADGALTVSVEPSAAQDPFDTSSLQRKISDMVEYYPVSVELTDSIPQTAAGKHRLVISDLVALSNEKARANGKGGANGHIFRCEPFLSTHAASPAATAEKAAALRRLIERPELSFLMESHNGLSAKIVEEAGFEGIWASGLSISASLGLRDANEASWTQVLEILEFMNDAVRIPILVDGDTGHGNFNNMRRFVQKLEQRGIAGVCIEDKVFPKTNSFIRGEAQPLADIQEFCGRIAAGCDARISDEFVIVARVEALIAGLGMDEAIKRAEAYRKAGADAILIHSAQRCATEVLDFKQRWGDRLPVVIVPTQYYATPTEVFRRHGFSTVIWANHIMRSCVTQMQRTARQIFEEQSVANLEDGIAPLAEVFRLQDEPELRDAEKRYLPVGANNARTALPAAAASAEVGRLTGDHPLCDVASVQVVAEGSLHP